eukprot:GGOE01001904.1.p1 GENE.GGOE01001904.1~~GGOE01001904.1.p1  ORF type:complete len:861 (+),score=224.28 GGOE01001904.1:91-2673(+)
MSERVQVVVRFRPDERAEGVKCVELDGAECRIRGDPLRDVARFTFDRVLPDTAQQAEVYRLLGPPTVENVLKGYNSTLLAYGQTGSGKTHSMFGPRGGSLQILQPGHAEHDQRGLIPRLLEGLFDSLEGVDRKAVDTRVWVSAFELYREEIVDLLGSNPGAEYRIREDAAQGRGVFIENLKEIPVSNLSEAYTLLQRSAAARTTAATNANQRSSRSHSVTQVVVEQASRVQQGSKTRARLTLVDLAGSEKVDKTGAEGDRLKEAQRINLSLTLLGNVIYKLTDGKSVHIPYRDSKLTRLLQDSLGGNARTVLLCHASPAAGDRDETLSTLLFAARAKQIHNKPRLNKQLSPTELALHYCKAQQEIRLLRDQLVVLQQTTNGPAPAVAADPMMASAGSASPSTAEDPKEEARRLRGLLSAALREAQEARSALANQAEEHGTLQQTVEFHRRRAEEAEQRLEAEKASHSDHLQLLSSQLTKARLSGVQKRPPSPTPAVASIPPPSSLVRHPQVKGSKAERLPIPSISRHLVRCDPLTQRLPRKDSLGRGMPSALLNSASDEGSVDGALTCLLTDMDKLCGTQHCPHCGGVVSGQSVPDLRRTSNEAAALLGALPCLAQVDTDTDTDGPPSSRTDGSLDQLRRLRDQLQEAEAQAQELQAVIQERDMEAARLQVELEQATSSIYQLERAREMQRRELEGRNATIHELQEQLDQLRRGAKGQQHHGSLTAGPVNALHVLGTSMDVSFRTDDGVDARLLADQLAGELLMKGEELQELVNDVYLFESSEEDSTELQQSLTLRLHEAQSNVSRLLELLASPELQALQQERHYRTLVNQATDLKAAVASASRRVANPVRRGIRRTGWD